MTNYSIVNITDFGKLNKVVECDFNLNNIVLISLIVIFLFVFGIIGNLLICVLIIINTHMHTSMNCYLFSLAICDIVTLLNYYDTFTFDRWEGTVVVQLNDYIRRTFYVASVLIILAISVDRYIAVCHPFIAQSTFSILRTLKIILSIWICAVLYVVCLGNVCRDVEDHSWDKKNGECRTIYVINLLLSFFIPVLLMTIMYTSISLNIWRSSLADIGHQKVLRDRQSSNKRGLILSAIVVAEFFIGQGPMHLVSILKEMNLLEFRPAGWAAFIILAEILQILSYIIDPIIYGFVCSTFRQAYKDLFCSTIKRWNQICSKRNEEDGPFILQTTNI